MVDEYFLEFYLYLYRSIIYIPASRSFMHDIPKKAQINYRFFILIERMTKVPA